MRKKLLLVASIMLLMAASVMAQAWDYLLTGDVLPSEFVQHEVWLNGARVSFADTNASAFNYCVNVATDPDDATNKVLQIIDLFNIGTDVKQAVMPGNLLKQDYDKMTFLFRARCPKPDQVPDSLAADAVKCRRFLGWNITLKGCGFQVLFETNEDAAADVKYPAWYRVARIWADSAATRNDQVDKFKWNTYRITAQVSDADSGLIIKCYLNENPVPVINGIYKESYRANATGTDFFYGDDRTDGWKIDANGLMNGGAKAWFDWVAVSYGQILPPGSPLPLNVKVDGATKNEGWVWVFDGSKNLADGASNVWVRISDSTRFNNSDIKLYQAPKAVTKNYNKIFTHKADPENAGNMLVEVLDDYDYNPFNLMIGPYVEGANAPRKGTLLFRAKVSTPTELDGFIGRIGWATTMGIPEFGRTDFKVETGYYGDPTNSPCLIQFFGTDRRYAYNRATMEPNPWLKSIGGTYNEFVWHTYRVTWDSDIKPDTTVCKLYVDENPIPAIINSPTDRDLNSKLFMFNFGDQRTNGAKFDTKGVSDGTSQALWDYVALNFGNAYAPGQGDIPKGLIVNKVTAVAKNPKSTVESFTLAQNYPNPFNPTTQIEFSMAKDQQVELCIYNVLGRKVRTLIDARVNAGTHAVNWNGLDDQGAFVGSGIYYYRIKLSDGQTRTHKMVLMK